MSVGKYVRDNSTTANTGDDDDRREGITEEKTVTGDCHQTLISLTQLRSRIGRESTLELPCGCKKSI